MQKVQGLVICEGDVCCYMRGIQLQSVCLNGTVVTLRVIILIVIVIIIIIIIIIMVY